MYQGNKEVNKLILRARSTTKYMLCVRKYSIYNGVFCAKCSCVFKYCRSKDTENDIIVVASDMQ